MNPAQIIAKFYDARDGLKAVLGDAFNDRIEIPVKWIRDAQEKHQCNPIQAFIEINKKTKLEPWEQVIFMAAVCEIVEREERAALK